MKLVGYVDALEGNELVGWLYDADAPERVPSAQLLLDGAPVARVHATIFRPDVVRERRCALECGFAIEVPKTFLDGRSRAIAFEGPDGEKVQFGGLATMQATATATAAAPKRKYTGYLDEYSQRPNPWLIVATHGVVDAGGDLSQLRSLYETYGVVKVRGLLEPRSTAQLLGLMKEFTGLGDLDLANVVSRRKAPFHGGTPALKDPRLWPIVTHPNVERVIRQVYGSGPVTEIGTSFAAHYSARGLHRDFPTWSHPTEGSYNLTDDPNSVLRLLIYPNAPGRPGGTFGFIPFTHRKTMFEKQAKRIGLLKPFEWYDTHREIARKAQADGEDAEVREMDAHIVWTHLDAGDGLLLDARIIHGGDFVIAPRYLFIASFVREDEKSKGLLSARWRAPLGPREREYYEHLHEHGFASQAVVAQARAAEAKLGVQGAPVAKAA